ncbi:MAG TPA: Ig-like domain-containing protein [Anaerolineae bacterium]|nr:Ig-like domain-containing protein [Anaerolineae bacterium]
MKKTTRWNRLFCIVVLLATLAACTGAPSPTPTPLPTPPPKATVTPLPPKPVVPYTPVSEKELAPSVLWRTPQRGESLAPDASIELVFDQPMAPDSVRRALTVQTAATEPAPVTGELTWRDERTAVFKPGKALYDAVRRALAVWERTTGERIQG